MIAVPGLGDVAVGEGADFAEAETGGDGRFRAGRDGVQRILVPRDRKVELLVSADKTLVYIKTAMGYPAIYPLEPARFEAPAAAVLMDLDGTSAAKGDQWSMGARIREVEQGPGGAIWVLEDGDGGRLLRLDPAA